MGVKIQIRAASYNMWGAGMRLFSTAYTLKKYEHGILLIVPAKNSFSINVNKNANEQAKRLKSCKKVDRVDGQ